MHLMQGELMDALEFIKGDHDRIRLLFEQAKAERGFQQKKLLYENIRNDLRMHAYCEETVFYPAAQRLGEFGDYVVRARQNHNDIRRMIDRIESLPEGSLELDSRLDDLATRVFHHIREEESVLFPRLRKLWTREERESVGKHLQVAKDEQLEAA